MTKHRVRNHCLGVCGVVVALSAAAAVAQAPAQAPAQPSAAATGGEADDTARKAEILTSPRWKRAVFELGQWLDTQPIYTPAQVARIKSDFNVRVAGMSSYDVEYLLDDLDAKFKIMDSPEAQDAKAWVGQYLSVVSDAKRAQMLRDVPDVVKMSAGQLQREINAIEQRRAATAQAQAGFAASREATVQLAEQSRQATAQAAAAATRAAQSGGGMAFSPYRSHEPGKTPFADAQRQGMNIGIVLFCWVAREAYGAEDPRWLEFRAWMLEDAPSWLREFYAAHGPEMAAWLRAHPQAKPMVRALMNRAIAGRRAR